MLVWKVSIISIVYCVIKLDACHSNFKETATSIPGSKWILKTYIQKSWICYIS